MALRRCVCSPGETGGTLDLIGVSRNRENRDFLDLFLWRGGLWGHSYELEVDPSGRKCCVVWGLEEDMESWRSRR